MKNQRTTQLAFAFVAKETTPPGAYLPAMYTFTADGHRVRKQTQPTAPTVDWEALAAETALPLEPVADDEIFAVAR